MGESYKLLLLFCWTLAEPESCGTGYTGDSPSISFQVPLAPIEITECQTQSPCLSLLNAGNLTWLIPHFGMGEQGEIQN